MAALSIGQAWEESSAFLRREYRLVSPLALAFFAKFAKVILLGLAVVGGAAVKVFGKRKKAVPAPVIAAPGEPPQG